MQVEHVSFKSKNDSSPAKKMIIEKYNGQTYYLFTV